MKYCNKYLLPILFILFCSLYVMSCSKPTDGSSAPQADFISKPGYTYMDGTVSKNKTILIGVEATKTGNDLIRYINFFCSYNNRPDSLLYQEFLPGTGTSYAKDFYVPSGDTAYTEKYTVEVHSYLGAITKLHLNLNVQ